MKLKPCPMCGGEMRVRLWNEGYMGQYFHAVCGKCGLQTGIVDSEQKVYEMWGEKE